MMGQSPKLRPLMRFIQGQSQTYVLKEQFTVSFYAAEKFCFQVKFLSENSEGDMRFFSAGLEGNFREWAIEKVSVPWFFFRH